MSNNPDIAKHYLESKLEIHMHVCSGDGEKYCAVFCVKTPKSVNGDSHAGMGWIESHRDFGTVEGEYQIGARRILNFDCVDKDKQQFMFVNDVQVVNDPEGVGRVAVPSIVRLQPLDLCGGSFVRSLYLSSALGLVFLPVFIYGESDPRPDFTRVRIPIRSHRLPRQVIEARTKMVNDFTCDGREFVPRIALSDIADAVFDLSRISVVISYNRVRAIKERANLGVEIVDMLVGPLNFDPATIEWMRHPGAFVDSQP